jgi:Fic family protein
MISFELNTALNQSVLELDNAFINAYANLSRYDADELIALQRFARISSIGASTRIENALLTDSEVNWLDTVLSKDGKTTSFLENKHLIEDKLSKKRERSIEEVAGCRNMMFLILNHHEEMMPLKEADIRALHYELMSPYQGAHIIGRYKEQPNFVVETNHISKSTRVVFKTADAGPITSAAMGDLMDWYKQSVSDNDHSFLRVCELVFRFLAIHPFQDGNGRLGRGLFLLGLLQSSNIAIKTVVSLLAIDRQIEKRKEEYYFTLNRCSKGMYAQDAKEYHIEYFCAFMVKVLTASLADIEHYRQKYRVKKSLSESSSRVLDCFNEHPEIKLSNRQIVEMTKLPRRTVANALKQLKDNHLIQSYGDGAGSRYQLTF